MLLILLMILVLGYLAYSFSGVLKLRRMELGRFSEELQRESEKEQKTLFERVSEFFSYCSSFLQAVSQQELEGLVVGEEERRYSAAEKSREEGKFQALAVISWLSWIVAFAFICSNFATFYIWPSVVLSFIAIVILPPHLLKQSQLRREELIQRDLPLFVDLLNLTIRAGRDLASALEEVIAVLASECPKSVLYRELKRAQWLVSKGYTWPECLERMADKLNQQEVARLAFVVASAFENGGDRSLQLNGIALDAQGNYYSALDRRLAGVPLKALLVTLGLFFAYFAILLAPSALGFWQVL